MALSVNVRTLFGEILADLVSEIRDLDWRWLMQDGDSVVKILLDFFFAAQVITHFD